MAKRKNLDSTRFAVIIIIAIVLVVLVISNKPGFGGVTGEAKRKPTSTETKANSCDADSVCEVAKTISTHTGTGSALLLKIGRAHV